MKKRVIGFFAISAAALIGAGTAMSCLWQNRTEISYERTDLYGDPAYAEGLSFGCAVATDSMTLRYNCSHTEDEMAEDYAYIQHDASGLYSHTWNDQGMDIAIIEDSITYVGEENLDVLPFADQIREAAKEVGDGETKVITLDLKDYYDYLPMHVECRTLNGEVYAQTEIYEGENDYPGLNEFLEYFKIPLLDSYPIEITITRDYDLCVDIHDSTEEEGYAGYEWHTAVNGDNVWIAFSKKAGTEADEKYPLMQEYIEEHNLTGIYRLDAQYYVCEVDDGNGVYTEWADSLFNRAADLDDDTQVEAIDMVWDDLYDTDPPAAGGIPVIYLRSSATEEETIETINADGAISTLAMGKHKDMDTTAGEYGNGLPEWGYQGLMKSTDNELMYLYDIYGSPAYQVVTVGEDGSLKKEINGALAPEGKQELSGLIYDADTAVFDFKDGKAAIVTLAALWSEDGNGQILGSHQGTVYAAVYDESGLCYLGLYGSRLCGQYDYYNESYFLIKRTYEVLYEDSVVPLSVAWSNAGGSDSE